MRGQTANGKGGATRPRFITRQMWELNYELACEQISRSTYYRRKRKLHENQQ